MSLTCHLPRYCSFWCWTSLCHTCAHSFPSVLLRGCWLTQSWPEALSVPRHPQSPDPDLQWPGRFLCSPSQALGISMWSPRRAECLTFILWKTILCRRDTGGRGGACYPWRVIQGCKFKHQVPLANTWENCTLPSKQVHKYVPRTLLKYHRFVS